jgi:uncharacterized membrane protein
MSPRFFVGDQGGVEVMNRTVGLFVVVAGVAVILVGILIFTGALSWFGRLPGDIRYESSGVRVYIPIVSMLLVSAVLSLLFYLVQKIL